MESKLVSTVSPRARQKNPNGSRSVVASIVVGVCILSRGPCSIGALLGRGAMVTGAGSSGSGIVGAITQND